MKLQRAILGEKKIKENSGGVAPVTHHWPYESSIHLCEHLRWLFQSSGGHGSSPAGSQTWIRGKEAICTALVSRLTVSVCVRGLQRDVSDSFISKAGAPFSGWEEEERRRRRAGLPPLLHPWSSQIAVPTSTQLLLL